MKKKDYEKPVMQVFELKQQPQLLAGSDPQSNLDVLYEEEII